MPKTKKPFALSNFDGKRILQRRYFKDFGFDKDLSDAEILKLLMVKDEETVNEMEKKLSTLKSVLKRVHKFEYLTNRQNERYNKIERRMKEILNLPENDSLVLSPPEYSSAFQSLTDLSMRLYAQYCETEKIIQKRYRKNFTERLKHYRRAAGLTQKELGELVNVPQNVLSRYEGDKREIPIYTLIRISNVLGISADKILGKE